MTVLATSHDRLLQSMFLGQWRKDRIEARGIVALAACEDERHTNRFIYRARMEVRGKSTPRASHSLGRLATGFFNAPAAC